MKRKTFTLLSSLFVLSCVYTLVALPAGRPQQQKLTNEDVVKMVKAGLTPSIVEQTIKANDANFDLSSDGLIKLKEAGVPDSVVQAMIARGNIPANALGKPDGDCGISDSDPMILIDGAKRMELKFTVADTRVGLGAGALIGKGKGFATLKGNRAETRIPNTALPIFEELYVPINRRPEDVAVLAKLDVKSDRRQVEIARASLLSGSEGIPKTQLVPTSFEVASSRICDYQGKKLRHIRIRVLNPLQPGEYSLIISGVYFFDFGVD